MQMCSACHSREDTELMFDAGNVQIVKEIQRKSSDVIACELGIVAMAGYS